MIALTYMQASSLGMIVRPGDLVEIEDGDDGALIVVILHSDDTGARWRIGIDGFARTVEE